MGPKYVCYKGRGAGEDEGKTPLSYFPVGGNSSSVGGISMQGPRECSPLLQPPHWVDFKVNGTEDSVE